MLMDNHCGWALPQPSAALPLDVLPVLSPSQCAHPAPLSTAPLGEGTGCQSSGVAELRQGRQHPLLLLSAKPSSSPECSQVGHHHLPVLATPDVLLVLNMPGNISQGYSPITFPGAEVRLSSLSFLWSSCLSLHKTGVALDFLQFCVFPRGVLQLS